MPVLQIKSAVKRYGEHCALKALDLKITHNEFFGLIGLNGAGKTSLIKCILDLHSLSGGEISIYQYQHNDKRARAQLAYLPEKFNPPAYMSGKEYLHFALDAHGCEFSLDNTLAVFDVLDLSKEALTAPIKTYSKGMLQKLGIAACLLSDKPLLILDEPMSGLDPRARRFFRRALLEAKTQGKTVLISTHLLADIEQLCDKVALLHKGELCFIGTLVDCYLHYKSENLEQAFLKAVGAE